MVRAPYYGYALLPHLRNTHSLSDSVSILGMFILIIIVILKGYKRESDFAAMSVRLNMPSNRIDSTPAYALETASRRVELIAETETRVPRK